MLARSRGASPLVSLLIGSALVAGAAALARGTGDEQGKPPPRPESYGFTGPILSKFNEGLQGLQAADVDDDGDVDLVVINNPKARVEFLLQRKPGDALPDEATRAAADSVNALPDEVHFRRDSFPTEQKVTSLAIADFNGDGRVDLAFVGDSGKLTVAYRGEKGQWGERARFDVENVSNVADAVAAGDLDGDGRADVAVLGKEKTFLFLQEPKEKGGRLASPLELLNATQAPDALALADLDGDRRLELVYVKAQSDTPIRWRTNRGSGGDFGPERSFPFTEIRGFTLADVDGDGRSEVAVIRKLSGRLALLRQASETPAASPSSGGGLRLSAPRVVAYSAQKGERARDEVLADLDGDGKPELLVAEPSAARVVVHRADPDGLACRGEAYPSLVGCSKARVADLDGDGRPELIVAATDETAIGVAKIDAQGRIGFPSPLAYKGEQLLALDVADVDHGGHPSIYAVVASGKGSAKSWSLSRIPSAAGGEPTTTDLGKLAADPNDLLFADLDRDGLEDALVFVPTEMPRILLAKSADGKIAFEPVATQDVPMLGILKGVARPALFFGDTDGDGKSELLVPGPNFARAFTLGAKGAPQIVAQWNLDDAGAKVGAVAAGDLDGDGAPEVVLTEKGTKSLRVLKRVDGRVQSIARVELGELEPKGLRVADLGGRGVRDVLLLAADRFAVIQGGRTDASFATLAEFESPLQNAHLDRVAFGDVNSDGVTDAVLTETNHHLIEIAAVQPAALTHVLQFPIFEESIFEREGGAGREPRELVLADVTGDRKLDLALLVHDHVLVDAQE